VLRFIGPGFFAQLEDGDRIKKGARSSGKPKRSSHNEEFATLIFLADFGYILEVQAIGANHSHCGDLKSMDGIGDSLDVTGHCLSIAVGKESRDFSFVQERYSRGVQASLALAVVAIVPRPQFETTTMMTGPED
jgi:hypothetical protein